MALIVFLTPCLDQPLRLLSRLEPVRIQAFLPNCPGERLHGGMVRRLAGSRDLDPHPVLISPEVHLPAAECTPVVPEQPLPSSALRPDAGKSHHNMFTPQASPSFESPALGSDRIHQGQRPNPSSLVRLVGYKVQAPRFIRSTRGEPYSTEHPGFSPPRSLLSPHKTFLSERAGQPASCPPPSSRD